MDAHRNRSQAAPPDAAARELGGPNVRARTLARMRARPSGWYPLEKSPLYRMKSLHKLAAILEMRRSALMRVFADPEYTPTRIIVDRNSGKERAINEPRGNTCALLYRLLQLLDRVERPSYLHSATRGKSNVSHARFHAHGEPMVSADIKKFYENTRRRHLKAFFRDDLKMALDLANGLAAACCVEDRLPLGSPVSPLLGFLAHRQTFDAIAALCERRGVRMSMFGDDMAFSGPHATRRFLGKVESLVLKGDMQLHHRRSGSSSSRKIETGVLIQGVRIRLPAMHRKRILDDLREYGRAEGEARTRLKTRIAGRIGAASQIDPAFAKSTGKLLRQDT